MSEKFKFRRGQVGLPIPDDEMLGVGEPIHDIDKGALGLGAGEADPRWYPGIDIDGTMRMQAGQKLKSNDGLVTVSFDNQFFTVSIAGKEALKVSEDGEAYVSSFRLTDTLKFNTLETENFGSVPGFSFKDGIFKISAPLEITGGLNLSLSDFAAGILPTNYRPGDVLVAGEGNSSTHQWKSADALITGLNKLAPLLYRTANRNTNTLDMMLDSIPSIFAENEDENGMLTKDLVQFASAFGGGYSRSSVARAYNRSGNLVQFAQNKPRYDFDPYNGRARGLLIEGYSKNLMTNSGNISTTTGSNLSALQISRAEWLVRGLRNPYSLTEQGNAEHYREVSAVIQMNKPVAFSEYIEMPVSNGNVHVQLTGVYTDKVIGFKFLLNGTGGSVIEAVSGGSGTNLAPFVERVSDTLYRIGFSGIFDAASASSQTVKFRHTSLNSANQTVFSSSASDVCYIGEWQIEPNDRVSSLIPTAGGVVERQPDLLAINLDQSFNFSGNKDVLGIKFMSSLYAAGDPVFSIKANAADYVSKLEGLGSTSLVMKKGASGSPINTVINDIDNDFTVYEFDTTGNYKNSTLFLGSNPEQTRFFQGWINHVYLYR